MKKIRIYSDGAARGNPDGPGGYGTIVKYLKEDSSIERVEEFTEGFEVTTNNRMELMGVIIGIESLQEPSEITVISDSKYVVDAFNQKWIDNWLKNNWLTSSKKPVKNPDLWKRLLNVIKPHTVTFEWIKGHAGHTENERCDYLATSSADGKKLIKNEHGIFIESNEEDENE